MAGFKVPVFEKGSVLTHEMLQALQEYSVDLGNLTYTGYSDGIVTGCRVSMQDRMISVERGIIMFAGKIYFVPKDMRMMVTPGNEWRALKFQMGTMSKNNNFMVGEINLEVSNDLNPLANKIEICRFRLQGGASLRNEYRDFNDLNTEFDTVNEIYAQWAGFQKQTVSKRILDEFAKEAIGKGVQNQQDIMFIQQILALDSRGLNRDAIEFYLSTRLQKAIKPMDNLEIYKGLEEVLRNLNGPTERTKQRQRDERRIIVD